jgi:hypothetical protein
VLLVTGLLAFGSGAQAQADDADKILKAMSDYPAGQKSISFVFVTDIEVITPDIEKIQFASSGQLTLSRPDKIRVSRTGGYADVLLVDDGKTATILGKNISAVAQIDSLGTLDQLVDRLRDELGAPLPGAKLDFCVGAPVRVLDPDNLNLSGDVSGGYSADAQPF